MGRPAPGLWAFIPVLITIKKGNWGDEGFPGAKVPAWERRVCLRNGERWGARLQSGEDSLMPALGPGVQALGQDATRSQPHLCHLRLWPASQEAWPAAAPHVCYFSAVQAPEHLD